MRLALKDLKHNVRHYLLVTIIIVLLMFMVLFLSGLVDGLGRAVSSGIEQLPADGFVLKEDAECLITVSSVTEEELLSVESQVDTKVATLDIFRTFLEKKSSDEKIDITYFAVNPEDFLNPEAYFGKKLSAQDENSIVLDDDFEAEGIQVGDVVVDSASGLELKVTGFTKDQMYGHIPIGFVSVETFRSIMQGINPNYQPKYHAFALKDMSDKVNIKGLETYTKAEIIDELPGYKAEQMTIKMVDWMLVFITAVIIGIFFFVINMQKEKEFGVLKAIGVSMGELATFIACEVGTVALIGALIAAALVGMMARALPGTMPFYLQTGNVILILCAFILISLFGSLFSIVKVAKIDPAGIIGGDN